MGHFPVPGPWNYDLVKEGLQMAGRTDLIGQGKRCLIPARPAGGWGMEKRTGSVGKRRLDVGKELTDATVFHKF
ncbi:MAG: DUF3362 domain-containing protein [Methanothrix sp.]|nr:DUF3362 domain-containing protein [Methanothrix sp.]